MEQIINYVKPELVVVSIALYFLGMWMKNSKRIKDNDIPIFLGIIGIIIFLLTMMHISLIVITRHI